MTNYRIREVDGCDEDVSDDIHTMHTVCFTSSATGKMTAPPVDTSEGWWWLAWRGKKPVAFASLAVLDGDKNGGYLSRSGVLPKHRGQGLQKRLIRAREAKACKMGLRYIVTDTTYNTPSSNSLIRAGYKLYRPKEPWGWKHTLYWRKEL